MKCPHCNKEIYESVSVVDEGDARNALESLKDEGSTTLEDFEKELDEEKK